VSATTAAGDGQASGAFAQRVQFVATAEPGTDEIRALDCVPDAVLSRVPAAVATEGIDVVVLHSGQPELLELQRRAEAWLAQPAGSADVSAPIDLMLRSDRVLWRPGRALVVASSERQPELLAGLVEFAAGESALRQLEAETRERLDAAAADVDLTHAAVARALSRQARVNTFTEWAARARIRLVLLETRFARSPVPLPPAARRLVNELAVQAEVGERFRIVDDQLEVVEDIYELANDRLTEYAYFAREYRIEMLILAVLVAELAVALWDWFF